jgi:acyl carrier protein
MPLSCCRRRESLALHLIHHGHHLPFLSAESNKGLQASDRAGERGVNDEDQRGADVPKREDPNNPIVVYGLDSLVAIEIRNWITRELEVRLQVLELLTSSSITALAETILRKSKLEEGFEKETGGDGGS